MFFLVKIVEMLNHCACSIVEAVPEAMFPEVCLNAGFSLHKKD